jgi:hypothetical protein
VSEITAAFSGYNRLVPLPEPALAKTGEKPPSGAQGTALAAAPSIEDAQANLVDGAIALANSTNGMGAPAPEQGKPASNDAQTSPLAEGTAPTSGMEELASTGSAASEPNLFHRVHQCLDRQQTSGRLRLLLLTESGN